MLVVVVFGRVVKRCRAGVFLLISMCKPAVFAIRRSHDAFFCVRIPVAVLKQKFRETVLEVHCHAVCYIRLLLVTDLICSDVSKFRKNLHIKEVLAVLPLETGESLVYNHTGKFT